MDITIFENESVEKVYFKMALPLVFSMIITLIYNLADTYFVAKTNNTAIVAAVSLCVPLFTILMALGNIMGQGGSSLISRLLGQGKEEEVGKVSAFSFYITIVIGIVISVVFCAFSRPILTVLGASQSTYQYAREYYLTLSVGAPIVMASFIHSNFLRAIGQSRASMIGTVSGAIVNIILDPIFISIIGWGAFGAAFATVLGYLWSVIFYIIVLVRIKSPLSLHLTLKINRNQLLQILGIGIPASIVNVMQSISVILINQFLLVYGANKIAAMGIALKINMIAVLMITGFTFGSQPLYGYYYGAKNREKLQSLNKFIFRFLSLLAVIITCLIVVLAPQLLHIFMNNTQIIAEGSMMLRYLTITTLAVAIDMQIIIIAQSFGDVTASFILSVARQGVFFVAALIVLKLIFGYYGILISQAVSDLLTLVLALVIYKQKFIKIFHT